MGLFKLKEHSCSVVIRGSYLIQLETINANLIHNSCQQEVASNLIHNRCKQLHIFTIVASNLIRSS
jgi:hypothetical protein